MNKLIRIVNCKILISLDLSVDRPREAMPCILYIKVVNCCIFFVGFFLHSIILHAVWLKMSKHVDLWSINVKSVGIIELFLIQYNLYVMCQFQQIGCIYKSVDKHKKYSLSILKFFLLKIFFESVNSWICS